MMKFKKVSSCMDTTKGIKINYAKMRRPPPNFAWKSKITENPMVMKFSILGVCDFITIGKCVEI